MNLTAPRTNGRRQCGQTSPSSGAAHLDTIIYRSLLCGIICCLSMTYMPTDEPALSSLAWLVEVCCSGTAMSRNISEVCAKAGALNSGPVLWRGYASHHLHRTCSFILPVGSTRLQVLHTARIPASRSQTPLFHTSACHRYRLVCLFFGFQARSRRQGDRCLESKPIALGTTTFSNRPGTKLPRTSMNSKLCFLFHRLQLPSATHTSASCSTTTSFYVRVRP